MKIMTKELKDVIAMLDDIVKEYKEDTPEKERDWRTYEEQLARRLKKAFEELQPLVKDAVSSIEEVKGDNRGSKPVLTLEQKVLVLLLKHIFGQSNRNMSFMFVVFSWLTNVSVSYKSVERLYSDEMVILALHNLHILTLKKKDVKASDSTGDGTGYALSVKKHYSTEAQKLKDKIKKQKKKSHKKAQFIYSFKLMDLRTRLYIGYGCSIKSEKEAFIAAIETAKDTGINIQSIRLDKYFSAQAYVKFLQENLGETKIYLIPKKNATINGPWEWKRMLHRLIQDPKEYLKEYFKRNQSESGMSEDKRRTGWKLGQKRLDRINTANLCTILWHNMYWLD